MTRPVAVSVRAEAYLAPAVRLMVELLKADGKRFFFRDLIPLSGTSSLSLLRCFPTLWARVDWLR